MRLVTCALSLLFSFSAFSQVITFKKDGKEIIKLKNKEIHSGKLLINGIIVGSVDKTMLNPWREYERTYRGYSLFELLSAVYGKEWINAKTIHFSALDGYKQIANIKKMIDSAQGKNGYIAYTETGKKGFSNFKKNEKLVKLGPYYLVWSNFTEADKASHGDHLKWPYQLKTIEINVK